VHPLPPPDPSTPSSLHPRYHTNPTTGWIRPLPTFSSPPTPESADPGGHPMLKVAIVVEIAPASNERSMKDSGCELGERRDVAASLASARWQRGGIILRKRRSRSGVRVRCYWASRIGWPREGGFRAYVRIVVQWASRFRRRRLSSRTVKCCYWGLGIASRSGPAVEVVVR
jgi:hypothetical protein